MARYKRLALVDIFLPLGDIQVAFNSLSEEDIKL